MALAWKVVKKTTKGNYRSSYAGSISGYYGEVYKIGSWTVRRKDFGPLTVFENQNQAESWASHLSLGHVPKPFIAFPCEYITSSRDNDINGIPNYLYTKPTRILRGGDLLYTRSTMDINDCPFYTILADAVRIF